MRTKPAVDVPVFWTVIVHVTVFDGFAQSRVAVDGVIVTESVGATAVREAVDVGWYCVPPQQS
jgi:3-deoxy-D-manno-octulosonate 8-phosphate phosphatase KdsC-like HAD superfamily phosphatase